MPYKLSLVVLTLAILPLLYVEAWLGLGAALVAYALAAKLANQDMDRAFLVRTLKSRAAPKSFRGRPQALRDGLTSIKNWNPGRSEAPSGNTQLPRSFADSGEKDEMSSTALS